MGFRRQGYYKIEPRVGKLGNKSRFATRQVDADLAHHLDCEGVRVAGLHPGGAGIDRRKVVPRERCGHRGADRVVPADEEDRTGRRQTLSP